MEKNHNSKSCHLHHRNSTPGALDFVRCALVSQDEQWWGNSVNKQEWVLKPVDNTTSQSRWSRHGVGWWLLYLRLANRWHKQLKGSSFWRQCHRQLLLQCSLYPPQQFPTTSVFLTVLTHMPLFLPSTGEDYMLFWTIHLVKYQDSE